MVINKSESKLVATCGPNGIEYIASTFQHLLDGARLAPKPEPVVTAADAREHAKSHRCI